MLTDPLVLQVAERLRERAMTTPRIALVLGSGLGDLAEAVEEPAVVPTTDVEGYPASSVAGHRGRLVFGQLEGVPVVIVQGRAHLYEGHDIRQVTYPVRLVGALGADRIILTNAAGGINRSFRPGTLMLITDHINFAGAHLPAIGSRGRSGAGPYTPTWAEGALEQACRCGVVLQQGTYAWVRGPSYETKAEIRVLRQLGADAVGMSTVPEALQAAALGMKVLGISTITNPAAGLEAGTLSHEDVLEAGKQVRGALERLLRSVLRTL